MKFEKVQNLSNKQRSPKLHAEYNHLIKLIEELEKRKLPKQLVSDINTRIEEVNSATFDSDRKEAKFLKKKTGEVLKTLEKKAGLVPKNHYRNEWMAIGMTAFGISLGVVFSSLLGNYAFLGIGIPIGMAIGLGIGNKKDKKAQVENRQLNFKSRF